MIPEQTMICIRAYVRTGLHPGDFLVAVLSNDLKESFGLADESNRAAMFDIVSHLYSSCPQGCWGSPQKQRDWMQRGGIAGIETEICPSDVKVGLKVFWRTAPDIVLKVIEILQPDWKDAPQDNPEIGLRDPDGEEEGLRLKEFVGPGSPYRKVL